MRPLRLTLAAGFTVLAALSFACGADDGGGGGGPDAAPGASTYAVRGAVAAWATGDPLPAPGTLAIEIFDAWESNPDPFAASAPVLARPSLDATGAFDVEVTEDDPAGLIAALVVDDAPGQADRVVATINDRRVNQGVAEIDGFAIDRARVDGWLGSPELGDTDPVALGAAVLTYLDAARVPVADVIPSIAAVPPTEGAPAPPVDLYFLSADGTAIEPGATRTTASGAILVVGVPGFLVSGAFEGSPASFELLGAGTRPGTIFVETVSANP